MSQSFEAVGHIMVPLVDYDQVKKVFWELFQPLIVVALQLLNVRNHHIGGLEIRQRDAVLSDGHRLRVRTTIERLSDSIKHLRVGRIEFRSELVINFYVRCHH